MSNPLENFDPRRIPIIGNDIYQVGQVYQIINQSCTPNPLIAVKAAWAYTPALIWMLLKPEPLDLAFNRVGNRHKRKRYRRVRFRELTLLGQPPRGTVGWALFRIADVGQKIGWYFLVADATTDFALNWSSMAYQWSGCAVPQAHYGYWSGNFPFFIESFGSPFQAQGDTQGASGNCYASKTIVGQVGGGPFSITYSGTALFIDNPGQTGAIDKIELQVSVNGAGYVPTEATEMTDPTTGIKTWTAVVESLVSNPISVSARVMCYWHGGSLAMVNQICQISGANAQNILPDP